METDNDELKRLYQVPYGFIFGPMRIIDALCQGGDCRIVPEPSDDLEVLARVAFVAASRMGDEMTKGHDMKELQKWWNMADEKEPLRGLKLALSESGDKFKEMLISLFSS